MRKNDFIEAYSSAIKGGTASLFIGAGLSMRAGYPSWRKLVKDMADEIGLDVEREPDLAGVVQFFLNKSGKTRTRLARTISDHFDKERPIPEIFRILARLPITHVWTSNYETLIERAWSEHRKRVDVKSQDKDIVRENRWAHAVLYKMHGTVEHASDVVIARGDYESYRRTRPGFLHLLTGHLVSRHMLFLGLSFSDPNLNHLFTLIRETFENNPPEHFTIVRIPNRDDYKTLALFKYATRRHELWVNDLQNYGIQALEVETYEEIDEVIESVEKRLALNSVLVAGSFPDTHDSVHLAQRVKIENTAQAIGRMLAKEDYRFVSGFGLVVGSAALSGVLDELNRQSTPNFEKSLFLRPFPQLVPAGWKAKDYYEQYRQNLVLQAGTCVFISGLKEDKGHQISNGVLAEFASAIAAKRIPIPIGATGGAAKKIWDEVNLDYRRYYGKMPRRLFLALNNDRASPDKLAKAVKDVLSWLKENLS